MTATSDVLIIGGGIIGLQLRLNCDCAGHLLPYLAVISRCRYPGSSWDAGSQAEAIPASPMLICARALALSRLDWQIGRTQR